MFTKASEKDSLVQSVLSLTSFLLPARHQFQTGSTIRAPEKLVFFLHPQVAK